MSKTIQPYLYRFLCVSAINTVVDIFIFNLLFYLVNDTQSLFVFIVIKGLAFIAAVTNSYLWHSRWTFKETYTISGGFKKFSKFLGINTFALFINVSVASVVFLFIQDLINNHFVVTNIAVIAGSVSGMVINLNGYKRLFHIHSTKN